MIFEDLEKSGIDQFGHSLEGSLVDDQSMVESRQVRVAVTTNFGFMFALIGDPVF